MRPDEENELLSGAVAAIVGGGPDGWRADLAEEVLINTRWGLSTAFRLRCAAGMLAAWSADERAEAAFLGREMRKGGDHAQRQEMAHAKARLWALLARWAKREARLLERVKPRAAKEPPRAPSETATPHDADKDLRTVLEWAARQMVGASRALDMDVVASRLRRQAEDERSWAAHRSPPSDVCRQKAAERRAETMESVLRLWAARCAPSHDGFHEVR